MQKQCFNLGWEHTDKTGFAALFNPHAWQPVVLPHDAMIHQARTADSPNGSSGGWFTGGVAHYRKKFHAPAEWQGQAVQLEFEGVYMNAEVSVNGQPAAFHPYGYTSFLVNLAPYLQYGAENVVNVVANNTAPMNSRWYSGTGIYRPVWLRTGGRIHIQPWGVFVTTPVVDPENSVVQISTEIANLTSLDGAVLRSTILDADGNPAAAIETPARLPSLQQTLLVKDASLWSIESPYLYTLVSEIRIGGEVVDSARTTFGIRSITVDPRHGLRLNGIPVKMKGGCIHHDHGPLGAASYPRAEERKIELLKSAGYNALRSAHNPPAPALLDACDRLGLLVIDETFDAWFSPKVTNDYHLYFRDWWQRDTEAMVKRDRNHPSVVLWSIGNEIFEAFDNPLGAEWSQRQADFIRSLDSTRFVTAGLMINFIEDIAAGNQGESFKLKPVPADPAKDNWGNQTRDFITPLDVAGYNYMAQRYSVDRERFPGRVIAGTETWGHMMYTFWQETMNNPQVIGDFVWTAMDYIGEAGGGQVSFDGKPPHGVPFPYHTSGIGDFNICGFKRVQSYYRDLLWGVRTAPFIAVLDPQHHGKPLGFSPWAWEPVLDTWNFPGQEGKLAQVDVYCADEEVELIVNGVPAGRKPAGAACQNKVSFDVVYQPGVIEAVGYRNGAENGRFSLETTGAPAALALSADRTNITADGGDLAFVTIEVHDAAGRRVKMAEPSIHITVSGAGELVALGSGNPLSDESYTGSQHRAFQGRLLAVIRSTPEAGPITITAQAEGLPLAQIQLQAQPVG
ncbi:MAG: glycoside hydrolase family 2 protein [Anaerolineae bacterium]|nr:glycoside hydrolase family 2 protein [Anaerolineae bacterium]